jgi:hypothetical protein
VISVNGTLIIGLRRKGNRMLSSKPALLLALLCLILMTPTQAATWREATSDNFIVYSDGSESELVNFTQRVEKFDRVLRIMTGLHQPPAPVKVRIYLIDGANAVREMDPRHRNIAGLYTFGPGGGFAIVDREKARYEFATDGENTLYHEYSHHYMAQYFPSAYPVWYQEGFADYFASIKFNQDGTAEIGKPEMDRLPALYTETWLSTQQLMTASLEDLPQRDWGRFYAQGWLLTHYLFSNHDRLDHFKQYLALRAQGIAHEEALQKAFSLTDQQLGEELRHYFSKGKVLIKRLTAAGLSQQPQVDVRTLSSPEADCLLLTVRIQLGVSAAEKNKLLEQVRTKAHRLAGNEYAQVMLGEAEAHFGDRALAYSLFQTQLASTPDNRRAMLDLATLELQSDQDDHAARLAADRRARTLAAKANRLDTHDPEALYLFYLSFAHEDNGPSQNAIDALAQAYLNLPQSQQYALAQARQDLHDGRPDRAVAELKPIAYSPHGEKYAQRMRAWIQDIEAKKSPALADSAPDESSDGDK